MWKILQYCCFFGRKQGKDLVTCKFISMLDNSGTYTDYMSDNSDVQLCTFPAYTEYRPTKNNCTVSFTACRKKAEI